MLPTIGAIRPWADPHVVSLGRLDMHAPTVAFDSVERARSTDPASDPASVWRRPLGGRWDFRLFDTPDEVTAAAIERPPGARSWTKVNVPGNWTLQGVDDHPQYTNVRMPFDGPPPRLPDRNPTGVYRRQVTVPARWSGRQVVIHIGGAESVHAVYVNGRFVGYGTDSRLASEYDVTASARRMRRGWSVAVRQRPVSRSKRQPWRVQRSVQSSTSPNTARSALRCGQRRWTIQPPS